MLAVLWFLALKSNRITLAMQPLYFLRSIIVELSTDKGNTGTYNEPAANIADIPIFLDSFIICKRHTQMMGKKRIMKSEATLMAEVTKMGMLMLMQYPSTFFSQILCRGVHSKIFTMVSAR